METRVLKSVLMEHPPKQGLKPCNESTIPSPYSCFNGTPTKTRIETQNGKMVLHLGFVVLMEHPPKQGLKQNYGIEVNLEIEGFNGTSTKTRIETVWYQ